MKKGKAYIIGAGPGDFELLTLKAKRIIENADCIVYDRLISEDILKLAKKDAELIYLGKGNTEGGLIQDEINQTLTNKCLEGKNVARVKGGDPFVFGRGGEEIEVLFKNEIEFEVVPGITSSISVPAYAGIPVTHRGLARSFHIFTGHTMENGKWHNFENIAKLEGTLVFLMGVKNLDLIVNDLIKYGKDSKTSVAIIEKGATKNQRVTVGNLENILELVEKNRITPPAITIIGEVVNLRETFKWFESEKLAKKILVTRDKKQAVEMSENISKRGGIPVELPFIEIENLKIDLKDLEKYKAILFNSPNGVKAFFENIKDIKKLTDFSGDSYDIVNKASKVVGAIKDGAKATIAIADTSYKGSTDAGYDNLKIMNNVFTAGVSYNKSESKSSVHNETVEKSSIEAGRNMNIKSKDGSISISGTDVKVGNDLSLTAKKDIDIKAAEEKFTSSSSSSQTGVSLSVNLEEGRLADLSVSKAGAKGKGNGTSYVNSTINVGGKLKTNSENLTLSGANVEADKVDIKAKNVVIESKQDKSENKDSTYGGGFSIDLVNPSNFSVNVNGSKGNGEKEWVNKQTSLIAKNGGKIDTENLTNIGAVIGSESETNKLKVSANKVVVKDLEDKNKYENIGGGVSFGTNVPNVSVKYDKVDKE